MKQKNLINIFVFLLVFVSISCVMADNTRAYTSPLAVDLGTASNFAILSQSGLTTATATSIINGNVGVNFTGTSITDAGICSEVNGTVYTIDDTGPACRVVNATLLNISASDMQTAYSNASGRTPDTTTAVVSMDGTVFAPGVYKWTGAATISAASNITINGSSTDVWIFQVADYLTTGADSNIILTGGADASNIFWQVGNYAALGVDSIFNGNILTLSYITLGNNATLNGRALAQTAVNLDDNNITVPVDDVVTLAYSNNATELVSTYSSTGYSNFSIDWNATNFANAYLEENFTGSLQNISMSGSYPNFYYNSSVLPAGDYQFRFVANDTLGNDNATDVITFTIGKASNPVNLYLNGTLNSDRTYTYPESINATGTSLAGTATLYRDGASTPNPEEILLGNGTYAYKINATGNQNYSDNVTGITFYALVNKGTSGITLYLNNTNGNKIYNQYQIANFTAVSNVSGLIVNISANMTGWVEPSGTTVVQNITNLTEFGVFNITGYTLGNDNYTSSYQTFSVTVNYVDVIPPLYFNNSTGSATPMTYYPNNNIGFQINCTDNIGIYNALFETGGFNYSMSNNTADIFYYNLTDRGVGTIIYKIYCNDTSGLSNATDSLSFTIIQNTSILNFMNLTINGTESNKDYTYLAGSNATGYNSIPELTFTLYRNDTMIVSPDVDQYGAGLYLYTYNTSGNTNYSAALKQFNLTIVPALSILHIAVNGSEADFEYEHGNATNVTAWETNSVDSSCVYTLYRNTTSIGTGSIVSDVQTLSVGNYTYIYNTTGCANFTTGTLTRLLNITDSAAPVGTVSVDTDPIYESDLVQNVTVSYNEAMDSDSTPIITFTGNLSIIISNGNGIWSGDNLTWTETFNITDNNEEITGVGVSSSGATDIVGNPEGVGVSDTFDIDTDAPIIDITSPVAAQTVNISFVITFTDDDTTNPQCSIDNASWVVCTNGTTVLGDMTGFSGLAEGTFTLYLRDNDTAGNLGIDYEPGIIKDTTVPVVTLNIPASGIFTNQTPTAFNFSVTDNLASNSNCTLFVDGAIQSNVLVANESSFQTTVGGINGLRYWNATCMDDAGNTGISETRNFTLDTAAPSIELIAPTNDTKTNVSLILLNFTPRDNLDANISCVISSGFETVSVYVVNNTEYDYAGTPTDGVYLWNVTCEDDAGNAYTNETRTYTIDATTPVLNSTSVINGETTANISFVASETVNATLNYGNSTSLGTNSTFDEVDGGTFGLSGLTAGTTYYYNITICDVVNCVTNGTFSFITDDIILDDESAGSGSTGGAAYGTYSVSAAQLDSGYSKDLAIGGGIKFIIEGQYHTVKIKGIFLDFVTIEVMSEPQLANISIGEEKSFDVNGDGIMDISVKLVSIDAEDKTANLIFRTPEEIVGEETVADQIIKTAEIIIPATGWATVGLVLLVVAGLMIGRYFYSRKKPERKRDKKSKKRNKIK